MEEKQDIQNLSRGIERVNLHSPRPTARLVVGIMRSGVFPSSGSLFCGCEATDIRVSFSWATVPQYYILVWEPTSMAPSGQLSCAGTKMCGLTWGIWYPFWDTTCVVANFIVRKFFEKISRIRGSFQSQKSIKFIHSSQFSHYVVQCSPPPPALMTHSQLTGSFLTPSSRPMEFSSRICRVMAKFRSFKVGKQRPLNGSFNFIAGTHVWRIRGWGSTSLA